MKFQSKLIEGKILKRYKRFLADIEIDGEVVTAHTANTGSMKTCWEPGWRAAVSFHDNPKRKLKYSLEMTHNGDSWIGVNTSLPNALTQEAIEDETINELSGYKKLKREKTIGDSRIDIFLSDHETQPDCYVEVKNVTLLNENWVISFPDGVTKRGQKHLMELMKIKSSGLRAVMVYIIQREDVDSFTPAKEIDPEYAKLLKEAQEVGVEILPYQCKIDTEEVKVLKKLPYTLWK